MEYLELIPTIETFFVKMDAGWQTLRLEGMAGTPTDPILYFAEIRDRTTAETLCHRELWVSRGAFPPLKTDEYAVESLLGCRVVDETDRQLGRVCRVERPGQHEVLVLEGPEGESMIPFVHAWIRRVDIPENLIVVASEENL